MFSINNIHPLSEFQRGAKTLMIKLKETKSPIVLTVNGKAAAVLQDAESYQHLLDRIELLESMDKIRKSIDEFDQGKGMPLNQAFEQLKEKYGIRD